MFAYKTLSVVRARKDQARRTETPGDASGGPALPASTSSPQLPPAPAHMPGLLCVDVCPRDALPRRLVFPSLFLVSLGFTFSSPVAFPSLVILDSKLGGCSAVTRSVTRVPTSTFLPLVGRVFHVPSAGLLGVHWVPKPQAASVQQILE